MSSTPRIQIQSLSPLVDCGRFPAKACVGDEVRVEATIVRDGHEVLGAALRAKPPGGRRWAEEPMTDLGNDRWAAAFSPDVCGRWSFRVEAWVDPVASFQWELRRKVEGDQVDFASELAEGALLLGREVTVEEALAEGPGPRLELTRSQTVDLVVDSTLARFGSWYELFPRSWGGFAGVERLLPRFAELGFDVIYLPPIHPIGHTNRKGPNNALEAGPDDPGSPWAIGSEEGGHTAVHSDLGTLKDFERLVEAAHGHELEIALDYAIQCSPDHPWLRDHPEWFHRRPDGTLKYAENPPKRYQDIYNVNFDTEEDREGLWNALRDVMLFWIDRGVRVFRVDNPHTKPVPFWEWLIAAVRARDPEVVLLSEAFTRPAMMTTLAKGGFHQSYTYFTWKNTKGELYELMGQLLEWSPFLRPNFFTNTPDILHEYLQRGGRPAFEARLVLAATLSPSYGIYSGFESLENVPAREGSEEYLDSEKYEVKHRLLDGELLPLVRQLNEIRREHAALQRLENLRLLETENEQLIAYAKDDVLVVVNLDPQRAQEGVTVVPAALGLPPAFTARDLLADEDHAWRIGRNYVRLEPGKCHVLHIRK
jgi:starch synthase (maltosyl-transferring)